APGGEKFQFVPIKLSPEDENRFENTQPELQPQEVTPAATVAHTSTTTTPKSVSRLIDFWQTFVADKSSGYPQFVAADDNKDEEYDDDDQWTADEIFVSDEDDIQDEYIEDAYFGEDYYTTYEGY
ncbi:unnamed protein product, partial [Oikopleura dioica]